VPNRGQGLGLEQLCLVSVNMTTQQTVPAIQFRIKESTWLGEDNLWG